MDEAYAMNRAFDAKNDLQSARQADREQDSPESKQNRFQASHENSAAKRELGRIRREQAVAGIKDKFHQVTEKFGGFLRKMSEKRVDAAESVLVGVDRAMMGADHLRTSVIEGAHDLKDRAAAGLENIRAGVVEKAEQLRNGAVEKVHNALDSANERLTEAAVRRGESAVESQGAKIVAHEAKYAKIAQAKENLETRQMGNNLEYSALHERMNQVYNDPNLSEPTKNELMRVFDRRMAKIDRRSDRLQDKIEAKTDKLESRSEKITALREKMDDRESRVRTEKHKLSLLTAFSHHASRREVEA
jgi:predicted  nucleic acid-binding Zn-ribbon protein